MKKVQAAGVVEFKSRVDRIAEFLKTQGYDVQHMHLMEGLSRYEGARDWRTYRDQLASTPAQDVVAAEDEVNDEDGQPLIAAAAVDDITEARGAAMLDMLYEWDDELSFSDILAVLRGTKKDGYASAGDGYTHLSWPELADALEKMAEAKEKEQSLPKLTKPEFAALETCLCYWGSLTYREVLEILDTEGDNRRQDLDAGDSQVGMSDAELAARIRSEYQFFLRFLQINPL